ncbi:MAG: TIGR04552 family protein [Oligoflexus sp.]
MQATMDELQQTLKIWNFHWGVMDVLIGGRSSIDLQELRFRNWHDATEFLRYYGFDPDTPSHAKIIHSVIIEAWNFIEKYLMPVEWQRGKRPPDKLLYADDARDIILAASDLRPETRQTQIWACSVLRVMHTIAHIDGVQRLLDSVSARDQIIGRFRGLIFRNDDGELCFGKKDLNVSLHHIEWKYRKTRESMILKLLHKKANVAETIYDMIGVRIVTQRLCDAMVVVKFLRDHHVVSFANCNPSRARNTLIDVVDFRQNVEMLRRMLKNQQLSVQDFQTILEGTTKASKHKATITNPHSSRGYRAIQLTCRQLIRYRDPSRIWLEKLVHAKKQGTVSGSVEKVIDDILRLTGFTAPHNHQRFEENAVETVGFFPFEIQIMDLKSFQQNNEGDANHLVYKKSQIRAARRRVLASVLTFKT